MQYLQQVVNSWPPDAARVGAHVLARYTDDALTAESVRHVLHLGYGALLRFREATGFTLGNFIEHARITQALGLLADTNAPVGHIAFEVGYHAHEVFTRAFRRRAGTTQSRYRQNHQAKSASGIVKRM